MFHTAVLGVPSRNLDLFFEDEAGIRSQLARHIQPDGLGVIEGVMGFYDGVSGTTDTASAAHLALRNRHACGADRAAYGAVAVACRHRFTGSAHLRKIRSQE